MIPWKRPVYCTITIILLVYLYSQRSTADACEGGEVIETVILYLVTYLVVAVCSVANIAQQLQCISASRDYEGSTTVGPLNCYFRRQNCYIASCDLCAGCSVHCSAFTQRESGLVIHCAHAWPWSVFMDEDAMNIKVQHNSMNCSAMFCSVFS